LALNKVTLIELFSLRCYIWLVCALLMITLSEGKLSTDQYLTHFWRIEMGTMKDVIDSKDMTQGNFTSFTDDRFGCPNSSLALNGGWAQVPPGIYFDTPEFSISVWVYPQKVGSLSRVIDFSNSLASNVSDNIILRLDSDSNNIPALNLAVGNQDSIGECKSSQALSNETWQLLTATFNGSLESLYINGTLTCSQSFNYVLTKITRFYNYIGKSFYSSHGFSWSFIDDLRFYNKSLTKSEILELMNQNETSGSHFIFESFR
jgi:hypothetical protein